MNFFLLREDVTYILCEQLNRLEIMQFLHFNHMILDIFLWEWQRERERESNFEQIFVIFFMEKKIIHYEIKVPV